MTLIAVLLRASAENWSNPSSLNQARHPTLFCVWCYVEGDVVNSMDSDVTSNNRFCLFLSFLKFQTKSENQLTQAHATRSRERWPQRSGWAKRTMRRCFLSSRRWAGLRPMRTRFKFYFYFHYPHPEHLTPFYPSAHRLSRPQVLATSPQPSIGTHIQPQHTVFSFILFC